MIYGFIGLGNMASAILYGMKQSGRFESDRIYGFDVSKAAQDAMEENCGVLPLSSAVEVAGIAETLILAVKPQVLPQILPQISGSIGQALVVSIAAGKPLEFYESFLPEGTPVVRVMPNINAKVAAATTAVCGNGYALDEHIDTVCNMFETVGEVFRLPESQFPVFSALSGASVAFSYMYMDALARASVKAGLPKKLALSIAAATVSGSAKLVSESGEHPYELVDWVCSPGGTTIEGVETLQRLGFESTVHQALDAVITKDKELGK